MSETLTLQVLLVLARELGLVRITRWAGPLVSGYTAAGTRVELRLTWDRRLAMSWIVRGERGWVERQHYDWADPELLDKLKAQLAQAQL